MPISNTKKPIVEASRCSIKKPCPSGQICQSGTCVTVPNCKPSGGVCSLNEECCSSTCDFGSCL